MSGGGFESKIMTFHAKPGKRYRAEIRLGLFEQVASNATIAEKLQAVGLTNVSVTGSGRERWAFGFWPGGDITIELPEQIVRVDEV